MKQSGADSHRCPFLYPKGMKTQEHTFGESPGQLGRRFWAKESQREMQLANGKDSLLYQCASFHGRRCLMVFTQSEDYTYLQNIPFFKQGESLRTYLEKCLPRKHMKYLGIMPSSPFVSHPWQDPQLTLPVVHCPSGTVNQSSPIPSSETAAPWASCSMVS